MSPEPETILIVDDSPEIVSIVSSILRSEYRVKAATSGALALKIASTSPLPDLIMLDVVMPEIDGYEVIRQLKQSNLTRDIPVIFLTANADASDEEYGLSLGANDYVTKPVTPGVLLARVKTHLALHNQNLALERKVIERTEELRNSRLEIIRRLGRAGEFRDSETGDHVVRMSQYSRIIACRLYPDRENWAELIYQAAPMHDIGKIGVPDHVLLKPGKLDEAEWREMQQHPVYGAEILGDHTSEPLQMARIIALSHHERWDGGGYPSGLAGEDIPLPARIVSVADVFDALTSTRPYKPAWSTEKAARLIREEAGKQFDPTVVESFLGAFDDILAVWQGYQHVD